MITDKDIGQIFSTTGKDLFKLEEIITEPVYVFRLVESEETVHVKQSDVGTFKRIILAGEA